jgi:hypothetical protein
VTQCACATHADVRRQIAQQASKAADGDRVAAATTATTTTSHNYPARRLPDSTSGTDADDENERTGGGDVDDDVEDTSIVRRHRFDGTNHAVAVPSIVTAAAPAPPVAVAASTDDNDVDVAPLLQQRRRAMPTSPRSPRAPVRVNTCDACDDAMRRTQASSRNASLTGVVGVINTADDRGGSIGTNRLLSVMTGTRYFDEHGDVLDAELKRDRCDLDRVRGCDDVRAHVVARCRRRSSTATTSSSSRSPRDRTRRATWRHRTCQGKMSCRLLSTHHARLS